MEEKFFRFIYERQLIWYKRFVLKQEFPWTSDPILATYKFCNVYRELDKCTIYIINKLKDLKSRSQILINVIFFRFFNKFNLYEDLGIEPFKSIDKNSKIKLKNSFKSLKDKNSPLFNNAYIISPGSSKQEKYITIINNLASLNLEEILKEIDKAKEPVDSFRILQKIPLVGPFLACEIWTDLTYFKFFKDNWTDNDFVNIGPGAKWGLKILYKKKLSRRILYEKLKHLYEGQESYLKNIHELKEIPWKSIADKKAFSNYPFLSITNIEGALCEFRKYFNLKNGHGRKRYFTH